MKVFIYKTISDETYLLESQLEELGKEGWELICVSSSYGKNTFYFKKEIINQLTRNKDMKTQAEQLKESLEEFDKDFAYIDDAFIGDSGYGGKTIFGTIKKLKQFLTTHTIKLLQAEIEKWDKEFTFNKKKPYDGLESANDYYGISAESWAEIIRYENGLDAKNAEIISHLKEQIKSLIKEK